jgi:hypothetical protein
MALPASPSYAAGSRLDLTWSAAIVAVAAAYYLIGATAPSLVLLAVLAYLCWQRSDLAVPLIPLAAPLFMLPKALHVGRHLEFSLAETVIVLCTAVVLAQQIQAAARRPTGTAALPYLLPGSAFTIPCIAFLGVAALATARAHFHTVALREYREVIVEPALFYWLILQRVRGPVGAARLVLAVVAAGVVVAVLGAAQLAFRPQDLVHAVDITPPQQFVRAVYGNENNLALLLDRAVPMALALALLPMWAAPLAAASGLVPKATAMPPGAEIGTNTRPQSPPSLPSDRSRRPGPGQYFRGNVERIERIAQALLLAGSALMLVILYRTGSRGGEVTVALCLAVLFMIWQRRRPAILAAGAAVLGVAAFLGRHRLASAASGGHGLSNAAHQSIWDAAWRMLRDHPLFGVGPDNFLYYYSDDSQCAPGHIAHYYYVQAGVNFERCISHPHNLFLDFWLSTGFLGLLAGLWLIGLFAVHGLKAYMAAEAPWRGPLLAALIAMLALVAHGQLDNSYFLPDLAVFFWLCLGVVAIWERRGAV